VINFKKISFLKHKKYREQSNLFICEGKRSILSALLKPQVIYRIYFSNSFKLKNREIINKAISLKLPFKELTKRELVYLSQTKSPSGILALCFLSKEVDLNLNAKKWLFLDNISDPGNLGTIIRSALWFNFKNIALSKNCVDPYNPKVVRSSMGAIFHLSIHRDINIEKFKNKYEIIGTSQKESNLDNFKTPKKFILIIGNEARGISKDNLKHINNRLGIKRLGVGESLNAAIAASIIMYRLSM
tara:strand:+ start:256 stop:987 length:732 start_codon:yes stop_codon:yes gene_type:complete